MTLTSVLQCLVHLSFTQLSLLTSVEGVTMSLWIWISLLTAAAGSSQTPRPPSWESSAPILLSAVNRYDADRLGGPLSPGFTYSELCDFESALGRQAGTALTFFFGLLLTCLRCGNWLD